MGSRRGRPNKRSLLLEAELLRLGINLPEEIAKLLKEPANFHSLTSRDKLNAYLELLQYVYPKRKALEVDMPGNEAPKVFILKWADDDTADDTSLTEANKTPALDKPIE